MQNLKVIYEDNHIIVVEKIPNIPSQSDKTEDMDMLTIVKEYIKEKYKKPGNVYLALVHRLDRPVRWSNGICKNFTSSSKTKRRSKRKKGAKRVLSCCRRKIRKRKRHT